MHIAVTSIVLSNVGRAVRFTVGNIIQVIIEKTWSACCIIRLTSHAATVVVSGFMLRRGYIISVSIILVVSVTKQTVGIILASIAIFHAISI